MNELVKWRMRTVLTALFALGWGLSIFAITPRSCSYRSHNDDDCYLGYVFGLWITTMIISGLGFLTSLVYWNKSYHAQRRQLTTTVTQNQATETAIEMINFAEPSQEVVLDENQRTLEDLEKEIVILKKQKEKAELIKEIKALERETELQQIVVASNSMVPNVA